MRTRLLTTAAALALSMWSATSFAGAIGGGNDIPEPGTWALVGLAAAIGWAVTRSKRK